METFDLKAFSSALEDPEKVATSGVVCSGKSLKLDTAEDAQPIVDAINACSNLQFLTLTGNTLGVAAAQAIATALEKRPELMVARFSDMFTGRMKTEIPPALSALGEGLIRAGARLSILDLSDNAFGPIGVNGLVKLLESDVCSELVELHLNNNGLGITGGRLLASALSARPRKLKTFVAGRNRLENDGATALAKVFQNMGTLEEVAMPQNGIYHVGIAALADAFKHNPELRRLNLNDNTIGRTGADCIAKALPRLKNLQYINFGDCLLKSRGAKTLARAIKENSMLIESVDLSHNEIGREACMEVVNALTFLPDSKDRLARVVLAGNSLGSAACRRTMKDKLGDAAELSDGEGSDDEYVTDSDSSQSEHSDAESHSEAEISQHTVRDMGVTLDTSQDTLRDVDVPPDTTQDTLRDVGVIPDISQVTLRDMDVTPDTTHDTLKNVDFTPDASQVTLRDVDVTPDASQVTLRNVDVTPDASQVTLRDVDVSPDTTQVTLRNVDVTPDTTHDTLKNVDVTPDASQVTLRDVDVTPDASQVTLRNVDVTPDASQVTLRDVDVSPDTTQVTLRDVDVTPYTTQVTLRNVDVTPDNPIGLLVRPDVLWFLSYPTQDNLDRLGPRAADLINAHLQAIQDPAHFIQAYVEATLLISGLPAALDTAKAMYAQLAASANQRRVSQWMLVDCVLRGLNLIKSENKNYEIRWSLPSCYAALGAAAATDSFPRSLKDSLRLLISQKLPTMSPEERAAIKEHSHLYSSSI